MRIKYLFKAQIINILAAALIATFLIFPDIIRTIETHANKFPPIEEFSPPPMPQNRDFSHSPKPPFNNTFFFEINPGIKIQPTLWDFLLFFFVSWCCLFMNNPLSKNKKSFFILSSSLKKPAIIIPFTLLICICGIYVSSLFHGGWHSPHKPFPWYLDGILLFKGIFIFISVVLFGQLIGLFYKQQEINLENERLKRENLQTRFDALNAQISPHFFFNSLNSLSGLIREKDNNKALRYIKEISNLFRYILKGNWQELVFFKDEMLLLNAYRYLIDIKYDDKLRFNIDISEEAKNNFKLPALSIQPLIENITKHNTISNDYPMKINIFIREDDVLIIQNTYQPKPAVSATTGIGLTNLRNRYKLLTNKEIKNYIVGGLFIVELPLRKINTKSQL